MDITVKNSEFLTAINLVRPAIDGKAGFESSHIYMKAVTVDKKGWLYLYCSNFFSQVITKIPVVVKEEGEILIPPQKLVDTLRTAAKEVEINVKTTDSKVKVKTVGKGFSFHLSCHTSVKVTSDRIKAQYPLKVPVTARLELKVLMEFFKRAQFCTLPTASGNSQLDSIKLIIDGTHCEALATDRIIAIRANVMHTSSDEQSSIMITKDEYGLLHKVFADQKDATVTITVDTPKGMVFFSANNTIYGARMLSGGFPDIAGLLKSPTDYEFHLSKAEFLVIAQRARIFANERRTVKILATSDSIELTTFAEKGKDGSDFKESIDLLPGSKVEGLSTEGKDIYVDIDYVINVLSTSSSSEILLGMSGGKSTPIRFYEPATEETKNTEVSYIMMGRTQW